MRILEFATVLLTLSAAPAASTPQRALAGNEDDQTRRFFTLRLPREASEHAESVLEHLQAGRDNLALTELQRLFEESAGHLLPGKRRAPSAEPSIYPTYPGAADWAHDLLLSLEKPIRERYRERFEGPAQAALESALAALDPGGLVRVATRWPLTRAAETAWWALGDLEAERGLIDTAAIAWRRAARLVEVRGGAPTEGASARAALVQRLAPEPPPRPGGGNYGVSTLLDTDVPRADADRWLAPLDLTPFGDARTFPVRPLLSRDQVFVNTSLRLYAVDAYTGAIRWEVGPHPSWGAVPTRDQDEYFDKIDDSQVLIGAAAAQGVVVAALQIPYSEFPDATWQGIPIFSRIPERRLMAFDAETGERLWDHVPRMEWRSGARGYELLEGNSEAQLSLVAAPPVVASGRVLVPLYRLQSRIEYTVACFSLATGEHLWSTPVISGQRERNMFGRAASEFVAAPLVVAGETVIAQTELGAIAALDLLSGELEWSSEYAQIPIRRNTSYTAPARKPDWRTAPPVVVDDLVIATPTDSNSLVCLELEDGAVRWSFSSYDLQRLGQADARGYEVDLLVGADRDTIYLGGEKLVALEKQGGLRSRLSFAPRWEVLVGRSSSSEGCHPLLTPELVVVPKRDERMTLDRRTGERVNLLSGDWQYQDRGALALGDGVLYSLGAHGLVGLFDWETLVRRQRARLVAAPEDPRVRFDTAALYLRRARALREREGETNGARRFLQDARDLLEGRFAASSSPEELLAEDREGALLLHALLREEARVLADLTHNDDARSRLREALALAPDRSAVRDTLLEEERLVRHLDGARRLELFTELAERVGDLPLSQSQLAEGPSWLIGEALLNEQDLAGWEEAAPEIGLWALLSRADELARRRQGEMALVALHEAAALWGDVRLNDEWTVGDVVHARIGRRLEIDGPEVYARFEAEAQQQLERALDDGDEEALSGVARRYPYSQAARRAEENLLERGFLARDARRVAELTQVLLERDDLDPALARGAMVRLGMLLDARGNRGFLAGFLALEAERAPEAELQVAGALGLTVSELAAEYPERSSEPRLPELHPDSVYLRHEPGSHAPVGELIDRDRGDAPVHQALFVVERRRVVAYDLAAPEETAWTFNVPYGIDEENVTSAEGRVLIGSRGMVRALDPRGRLAWQRSLGEDEVRTLSAGHGVVVALVSPPRDQSFRLVAWDARDGVPLWEVDMLDHLPNARQGWLRPLIAEGRALLFRRRFTEHSTAVLVDLFRGSVDAVIDLGQYGSEDVLNECAWVEDGRLCVPRYESSGEMGSTLGIYDLEDGAELWRMNFAEDEHFYAVARHAGRSYLVIHPSVMRRGRSTGAVYALDLALKRIRAIESIRAGELSAGLREGVTTTLDAPLLFFVPGESGVRDLPLRVLDLDAGSSSTVRLSVSQDAFYPEVLPAPVVGSDHIALTYRVQDPDTQLVASTRLEFVPREEGGRPGPASVGSQVLAQAGGSLEPVRLLGFGGVLYVLHGNTDGAARLDVYGPR